MAARVETDATLAVFWIPLPGFGGFARLDRYPVRVRSTSDRHRRPWWGAMHNPGRRGRYELHQRDADTGA